MKNVKHNQSMLDLESRSYRVLYQYMLRHGPIGRRTGGGD
eukprot:COSAG04_NODE_384_length_15390_cov_64.570158_5_plen_40_part_00